MWLAGCSRWTSRRSSFPSSSSPSWLSFIRTQRSRLESWCSTVLLATHLQMYGIWLSFARFGTSLLLFVVCDIFNPDNIIQYTNQTVVRLGQTSSQEHLGAPIYWSRAPIYWSPKILFSIFWGRMKRESSDKTRFCVSLEGLPNGLGTFSSPWFMFENKTKNMFLTRRSSNILEPLNNRASEGNFDQLKKKKPSKIY